MDISDLTDSTIMKRWRTSLAATANLPLQLQQQLHMANNATSTTTTTNPSMNGDHKSILTALAATPTPKAASVFTVKKEGVAWNGISFEGRDGNIERQLFGVANATLGDPHSTISRYNHANKIQNEDDLYHEMGVSTDPVFTKSPQQSE
jgi:hypothetical protein